MRGGIPVVDATYHSEASAGDPQQRTRRWWVLELECGHTVERPVSYRRTPGRRGRRKVGDSDVLPHQRSAYCPQCPATAAHNEVRLRVRAAPARAASWAAAMRALGVPMEGPAFRSGGFVDYYARTTVDLPVPTARPIAGSLVDIGARAAARARAHHRGDTMSGERLARYADQLAADPAYRAEIEGALTALAMLGYIRQRPDQEGSAYGAI